jgi:hypothetical protein
MCVLVELHTRRAAVAAGHAQADLVVEADPASLSAQGIIDH